MPAGFETYNDSGMLQFSAAAAAFDFVGKGSFTISDQWLNPDLPSGYIATVGSVEVAFDFDLVFFSSPDAWLYLRPALFAGLPVTPDILPLLPNKLIFCLELVPPQSITGVLDHKGTEHPKIPQ
jgi:hypothetical protein